MGDLDARIAATEAELARLHEAKFADLKSAYFANDARLKDIAAKFGMSYDRLAGIARRFGWKRPLFVSAETRARRRAALKAKDFRPVKCGRARIRPLKGTDEYRLFRKIADGNGHPGGGVGAAAAHAELRRGANG